MPWLYPVWGTANMKWFRSNIRNGSRLALFALAIQFVLSFGHFHATAAPVTALELTQTLPNAPAATSADAATDLSQPQPVSDHQPDGTADNCAICAVMALANAALFTTPPLLLLPEAAEFLYRVTDAEFVHLNAARVAFQPRAPPAS